jgi:hypothetical protein
MGPRFLNVPKFLEPLYKSPTSFYVFFFPYGQIETNKLGGPDARGGLFRRHQRCVN